jgi:hypothetical protein
MNPLKQKLIAMREELKSIADSGDDQAAVVQLDQARVGRLGSGVRRSFAKSMLRYGASMTAATAIASVAKSLSTPGVWTPIPLRGFASTAQAGANDG